MALSKSTLKVDFEKGPLAILFITTENKVSPSYIPYIEKILLNQVQLNEEDYYKLNSPIQSEEKQATYLVSFQLPEGDYEMNQISGSSGIFPVTGRFFWECELEFSLNSSDLVYLGNLDFKNRKKRIGEAASGFILPLIDQAVTGFSTGTIEMEINNQKSNDLEMLYSNYPFLKDRSVTTQLLKLK